VGVYRFNVYPNPTQGSFTVEHNYSGAVRIQLIDALGRVAKEFNQTMAVEQFNIDGLAAGGYQLNILDKNQRLEVLRLVKQ